MTSIATSGRNVLAELDKRVPTSFYWSLTLLATPGGFLFGYDTANIGSALPRTTPSRRSSRSSSGRRRAARGIGTAGARRQRGLRRP